MKMERSLQPHRQTTDGSATPPPPPPHTVPAAAGRMAAFMRISTGTCQTGTDSFKWQSDRFPEHWEATELQSKHNSIRQANKRTFPPEAADANTTC